MIAGGRLVYQLTLLEPAMWRKVKRCYVPARELADRHYPRETPGAVDFMNSGWTFVLYHGSEAGQAVWGVNLNRAPGTTMWMWRCSIFRNESTIRSSEMVTEATSRTYEYYRLLPNGLPPCPLTTEVDPTKVRRKRDPGRCFIKAGWLRVGMTTKGKVRLQAPDDRFPWDPDRVVGRSHPTNGSPGDSK